MLGRYFYTRLINNAIFFIFFSHRKTKVYVWNVRHASVTLFYTNCAVMITAAAYSDKEKPP